MRISDWSSDVCSSDLLEALVPVHERVSVVQAPDFEVVEQQIAWFERGQGFRCSGDVAAGEDVFADPGVAGAGWREATDRMDQRGAIGLEQVVEIGRESCRERVCQYV